MADKPLSDGLKPETMELVQSLLARRNWHEEAKEAFRKAYPEAPAEMIGCAVFHVYVDGIHAVLEWIAGAEKVLRDPLSNLDSFRHGDTFHLLYHLYNWQQFQALLPEGRSGVIGLLNDLKACLKEEDDREGAIRTTDHLINMFEAGLVHPKLESPD